jgi:hypothetical protein
MHILSLKQFSGVKSVPEPKKEFLFASDTRLPHPFENGRSIVYTKDLKISFFGEVFLRIPDIGQLSGALGLL